MTELCQPFCKAQCFYEAHRCSFK